MTNKGIVYCLSNPSFNQQIYKIGKTKHIEDPHKRIDLLHTTGVPTPFKIEFYIQVNNMNTIEKKFHNKLKQFRISNQREFFKVSDILLIKQLFTSIQGVFIESHCFTLSSTHTLPKDMYIVEKIINHKYDNNKQKIYEVKWIGYELTTWEPYKNLKHLCLLHQYIINNQL
jgi:hypothetical protein